jgi:hypothetical protein
VAALENMVICWAIVIFFQNVLKLDLTQRAI